MEELIRPSLVQGKLVICDRFIHSTLAYQGFGRGLDIELLNKLNLIATSGLKPDLTILLDLNPETGLARARKRADQEAPESESGWTRFEQEKLDFHQKLRDGFLELAKDSSQNIKIIDAEKSEAEVISQAKKIVGEVL